MTNGTIRGKHEGSVGLPMMCPQEKTLLQSVVGPDSLPAKPGEMIFVRTFWMGSDRHYPEEAPIHRATVDGFWMDRYPVTNRQFREFVRATGHVTSAEIPPDPKDYPGALPHMLFAGSLVFTRPAGQDDHGQSCESGE